jgi:hypothetical protein
VSFIECSGNFTAPKNFPADELHLTLSIFSRTWIDSLGHVFAHRSMHWDMGFVYPGLAMRVAPSVGPGGTLEFVLDPHREVLNKHSLKEIGTGRFEALLREICSSRPPGYDKRQVSYPALRVSKMSVISK